MRVTVLGAGAVGGVVGACLVQAGHDVTLVAGGAHRDVLRRDGLRVVTPDRTMTVRPSVVARPAELDPAGSDVVLLAVKSQDTAAALHDLAAATTLDTPIVCLQNGIDNERSALRLFRRVYAVAVMCPTAFVVPGQVISPTPLRRRASWTSAATRTGSTTRASPWLPRCGARPSRRSRVPTSCGGSTAS
jgi:2-dehydropantoate 2-reductase